MTRTYREKNAVKAVTAEQAANSDAAIRRRSNLLRLVALFFALGMFTVLASVASGQATYDVIKADPRIDQDLDRYRRAARSYASARDVSSIPASQTQAIQNYYARYLPAKITNPDASHLINDLMSEATLAMERGLRSGTPGSQNVMRWLYGGLKSVAEGNYQPAARINAIQFISRLSPPEALSSGIPRPYGFVLGVLKTIYLNEKTPEAVRAAALKGLDRFVRFTPASDIPNAEKAELTNAMNQLLQSEPPAGRDSLVHAFLQRYAVNILTNLSTDASFGKQLVSISTKESNPNLIALHSAAAIADLPAKMATGDVETREVLKQWSKRLLAAYKAEKERLGQFENTTRRSVTQPPLPESFLKETKEPKPDLTRMSRGMDGGMDDEMYGMEMMDDYDMMDDGSMGMDSMMMGSMMGSVAAPEQPAEVVASRKKLNYALQQVLLGVTGQGELGEDAESTKANGGLMAATPAESIDDVKAWLQSIIEISALLNAPEIGNTRKYVTALDDQLVMLESLAQGKSAKAPIPVHDDLFSDDPPAGPAAPAAGLPPSDEPAPLDELLN